MKTVEQRAASKINGYAMVAVGMVEMALNRLSEQHIVDLDEEKKATMVNNPLVVLTSEHGTQPVINAGTLYG